MKAIALFAFLTTCTLGAACFVAACTEDEARPAGGPADFDEDADTRPTPPSSDGGPTVPDATTCGSKQCTAATYEGLVALPPCCIANDTCGVDPKPLGSFLPRVPDRCVEVKAPGPLTFDCNDVDRDAAAADAASADGAPPPRYDGCCHSSRKTCGIAVKVGDVDFGCQLPEDWIEGWDAGAPKPCDPDAG